MKKISVLAIVTLLLLSSCNPAVPISDKEWNSGWSYWSDRHPERTTVNLPHDAMFAQDRDSTSLLSYATAYLPGDCYHYEKTIEVSAEMVHSHVVLQFEGVYRNPQVYINDQLVGGTAYGYIPFEVCADGFLREGLNTIRIDADNSKIPNSRWYSGGGIYRPIHLTVQQADAYIEQVSVETKSIQPALIEVKVAHYGGEVRTTILLDGKSVASCEGDSALLEVSNAQLWSAESPILYEARVELFRDGKVVETRSERFGIRTIAWNGQEGLLINGVPTLLRGGCLHHDNGLLGACEYDEAALRKVAILKQYGFNAIRSAHNPISPALLRACDSLGMYVMDELWDMWYSNKNSEDYAKDFVDNWQQDMTSLVNRDYNHPSVIMYSIGNEVVEPSTTEGQKLEQQLVDKMHALDPSRPVTCGMNLVIQLMNAAMGINLTKSSDSEDRNQKKMTSEEFNMLASSQAQRMMEGVKRPEIDLICSPGLDMLDIAGYNYGSLRAELDAQLHPARVQVGTETYPQDLPHNWSMVERLPQLIGDFMWTAWDHIGEMGIGAWYYSQEEASFLKPYPWLLSGAGALDLLGNPTGEALWAKAVWLKTDEPYLAVCPLMDKPLIKSMWRGDNAVPSWSWPGQEGKTGTVEVFTSAPKCLLYINDQLIGEQEVLDCRASFEVIYQPGTLRAVTISADGKVHTATLCSATGQMQIKAQAEKPSYQTGELIYVNIALTGDNGEVIANRDALLTATVEGGELVALGSAQPCTRERFDAGSYTTYYGQAQAILRASKAGDVKLTLRTADGLTGKTCIQVR